MICAISASHPRNEAWQNCHELSLFVPFAASRARWVWSAPGGWGGESSEPRRKNSAAKADFQEES